MHITTGQGGQTQSGSNCKTLVSSVTYLYCAISIWYITYEIEVLIWTAYALK
jgi:hypothetical protein